MKIAELPDCPSWLAEARTENADVERQEGAIVWYGGQWHGGVWYDGVWHGGDWHGGDWHGGVWHDGVWHGGDWHGGDWHGGVWYGGDWHGGVWCGGVWHGGDWYGGDWHGGVWCGGQWCGGQWHGGDWHGGVWHGGGWCDEKTDRLLFMAAACGIVFIGPGGLAVAYRTTQADGHGRHTKQFLQVEGEYRETDLPPAGSGTCVRGIHVSTAARAHTLLGVDRTAQMWEVTFRREDLLDCDGEKARIAGGVFRRIARPF